MKLKISVLFLFIITLLGFVVWKSSEIQNSFHRDILVKLSEKEDISIIQQEIGFLKSKTVLSYKNNYEISISSISNFKSFIQTEISIVDLREKGSKPYIIKSYFSKVFLEKQVLTFEFPNKKFSNDKASGEMKGIEFSFVNYANTLKLVVGEMKWEGIGFEFILEEFFSKNNVDTSEVKVKNFKINGDVKFKEESLLNMELHFIAKLVDLKDKEENYNVRDFIYDLSISGVNTKELKEVLKSGSMKENMGLSLLTFPWDKVFTDDFSLKFLNESFINSKKSKVSMDLVLNKEEQNLMLKPNLTLGLELPRDLFVKMLSAGIEEKVIEQYVKNRGREYLKSLPVDSQINQQDLQEKSRELTLELKKVIDSRMDKVLALIIEKGFATQSNESLQVTFNYNKTFLINGKGILGLSSIMQEISSLQEFDLAADNIMPIGGIEASAPAEEEVPASVIEKPLPEVVERLLKFKMKMQQFEVLCKEGVREECVKFKKYKDYFNKKCLDPKYKSYCDG